MSYESFENFHDTTCKCPKCILESDKLNVNLYCKTCKKYYKNISKYNIEHLDHYVVYFSTNEQLPDYYNELEKEYVYFKHIVQIKN